MKRFILPKWVFYPMATLFFTAAVVGVLLTGRAQQENYMFGLGVNQILRVVTRAREVRLPPNADPVAAQNKLIEYLVEHDGMKSLQLSDDGGGVRSPQLALINSWGELLKVILYPSERTVRLETNVSSNMCRRILNFYAADTMSLGLQHVEVIRDAAYNLWSLVYDVKRKKEGVASMDLEQIRISCSSNTQTVVSLTFLLP